MYHILDRHKPIGILVPFVPLNVVREASPSTEEYFGFVESDERVYVFETKEVRQGSLVMSWARLTPTDSVRGEWVMTGIHGATQKAEHYAEILPVSWSGVRDIELASLLVAILEKA